jgi:hypothetical protein
LLPSVKWIDLAVPPFVPLVAKKIRFPGFNVSRFLRLCVCAFLRLLWPKKPGFPLFGLPLFIHSLALAPQFSDFRFQGFLISKFLCFVAFCKMDWAVVGKTIKQKRRPGVPGGVNRELARSHKFESIRTSAG